MPTSSDFHSNVYLAIDNPMTAFSALGLLRQMKEALDKANQRQAAPMPTELGDLYISDNPLP